MNIINALIRYTQGVTTLEQTNQFLKEAEAGFHLEPGRNALTHDEILATFVSDLPEEVRGWGLLDSGTGSLDKAEVRAGQLVNVDCGDMPALVIIGGRTYKVKGCQLSL